MMKFSPADVQIVTVIRIEYNVGFGTEGDPVRQIVEMHDDHGVFLRCDTYTNEVECERVASQATTERMPR